MTPPRLALLTSLCLIACTGPSLAQPQATWGTEPVLDLATPVFNGGIWDAKVLDLGDGPKIYASREFILDDVLSYLNAFAGGCE